MKLLSAILIGLLLVLIVLALAFVLMGPERVWRFSGEPDLGPVSLEQFQRRASPNDALACPPDVCAAEPDITTSRYPVSAPDLRSAIAQVIASEPRMKTVASDEDALTDRYIQRTRWLGFPDTVVVQFFERPDGQSTLAIYSRSQLGQSDLGANRERLERWLAKLADRIQPVE